MDNLPDVSVTEQKVQAAFRAIQPDPAFAARLREDLIARKESGKRPGKDSRKFFSWRYTALIATFLFLGLAVWIIGAQDLLARARALFGFIPGIGFVEEHTAHHLCQPVEMSLNGINYKITHAGGSGQDLRVRGEVRGLMESNLAFELVDENGQAARLIGGGGGGSQDTFSFEMNFILTSESHRWTLTVVRNAAPPAEKDVLRLAFELCAGSQTESEAATSPGEFTYDPVNAITSGKGILLQVTRVAQTEQGTGLQVRVGIAPGTPEVWMSQGPLTPTLSVMTVDEQLNPIENLELANEAGQLYAMHLMGMNNPSEDPALKTFEFDPLQPGDTRATLRIRSVDLIFSGTAPFRFDAGDQLPLGQSWDLKGQPGSSYTINGFTITLLKANYHTDQLQTGPKDFQTAYVLEFDAEVVAPAPQFKRPCPTIEIGSAWSECSQTDGTSPEVKIKVISFEPLSADELSGTLGSTRVTLDGPWEIQWHLPK